MGLLDGRTAKASNPSRAGYWGNRKEELAVTRAVGVGGLAFERPWDEMKAT